MYIKNNFTTQNSTNLVLRLVYRAAVGSVIRRSQNTFFHTAIIKHQCEVKKNLEHFFKWLLYYDTGVWKCLERFKILTNGGGENANPCFNQSESS